MRIYIKGMTSRPVSRIDCRLKLKGYCLLQGRNRGHKTQREQYIECPLTEDDTAAGRSPGRNVFRGRQKTAVRNAGDWFHFQRTRMQIYGKKISTVPRFRGVHI